MTFADIQHARAAAVGQDNGRHQTCVNFAFCMEDGMLCTDKFRLQCRFSETATFDAEVEGESLSEPSAVTAGD